ncbi:hypothetical protein GEMRC1_011036 [Eukaryota sp. GEM-RC1]
MIGELVLMCFVLAFWVGIFYGIYRAICWCKRMLIALKDEIFPPPTPTYTTRSNYSLSYTPSATPTKPTSTKRAAPVKPKAIKAPVCKYCGKKGHTIATCLRPNCKKSVFHPIIQQLKKR